MVGAGGGSGEDSTFESEIMSGVLTWTWRDDQCREAGLVDQSINQAKSKQQAKAVRKTKKKKKKKTRVKAQRTDPSSTLH